MKFTKEQAVEEISAKIPAKDKDIDLGRTIAECVENALTIVGDNDELELSQFVAYVQPFVATAAGLGHKNAATATKNLQSKIADLESQLKPKADDNKPKEGKDANDDEIQSLLQRIEKLEKDKAEAQKADAIAKKRQSIANGVKKLGVDDSDWIDTFLNEINITDDMDVEQKAKDYVALYNKTHSVTGSQTPKNAGGPASDKIDLSGLDTALRQIRGDFGKKNN